MLSVAVDLLALGIVAFFFAMAWGRSQRSDGGGSRTHDAMNRWTALDLEVAVGQPGFAVLAGLARTRRSWNAEWSAPMRWAGHAAKIANPLNLVEETADRRTGNPAAKAANLLKCATWPIGWRPRQSRRLPTFRSGTHSA